MNAPQTTQAVFEQFLRGELTQAQAADAIVAITIAHKGAGGRLSTLAIRKPDGIVLTPVETRLGSSVIPAGLICGTRIATGKGMAGEAGRCRASFWWLFFAPLSVALVGQSGTSSGRTVRSGLTSA